MQQLLGPSSVAARKLGVSCTGFDVDAYYLDVARSRLCGWLETDRAPVTQLKLVEARETGE
jgi:hypothetical protein